MSTFTDLQSVYYHFFTEFEPKIIPHPLLQLKFGVSRSKIRLANVIKCFQNTIDSFHSV
jgi:hypothetical protein